MARSPPPNPSLEHLKKQAKDLRKAHQSGDVSAGERVREFLPRAGESWVEEILQTDLSLQEAQHVIARDYGCRHREMLSAVVAADFDAGIGLDDRGAQTLMREVDQPRGLGLLLESD